MSGDGYFYRELVDGDLRQRRSAIIDWRGYRPLPNGREWYQSVYLFDTSIEKHFAMHGSVRGFSGVVCSDCLLLDIDNPDPAIVRDFALYLKRTHDFNLHHIWNSGTGWHVVLPEVLFGGFEPSDSLPYFQKKLVQRLEREARLPAGTFDLSIYQHVHIIRCEHSSNLKKKPPRYKVPLELADVLDWDGSVGESPRRDFAHDPFDEFNRVDTLAEMWAEVQREAPNPMDKPRVKPPFDQNDRLRWLKGGIHEHQRDNALYHFPRQLKKAGIDKAEAFEITRCIRDARVEQPEDFDDATIRQKVDSAYSDDTPDLSEHLDDYIPEAEKTAHFLQWAEDCIEGRIPAGYRWGIPGLDAAMRLEPQHSYGVSALTGCGKSWLLLQVAHVATEDGSPVLLFSAELPDRTVRKRLIARRTGLDSRQVVTRSNLKHLKEQAKALDKLPLRVQTKGEPSIPYLEANIFDWKNTHKQAGGLVLIDYAGLVARDPHRRGDFADQDNTANAIADLAKRYDCATLTAFQQNKKAYELGEYGGGVSKGNVFGGGGQVHRLDGLVLIDRTGGQRNDYKITVDLRVAKNRDGPEPVIACTVDLRCGKFYEVAGSGGASGYELPGFG